MTSGIYTHKPFSKEHRKNMSEARKGIKLSEEHKRKISEGLKGKVMPEQQRILLSINRMGSKNPFWKGGVYINNHLMRYARKIMAKHLGRKLTSKETVHHLDGIQSHNYINNLYLFPNPGEHISYHIKLKKFVNEELLKIGFRYNFRSNTIMRHKENE